MANLRQLIAGVVRRHRRVILAFLCVYVLVTVMSGNRLWKSVSFVFRNENFHEPCSIPSPDPFDPSIMKFHWKPEPLECDSTPALVYVDERNVLRVNPSALGSYDVATPTDVVCDVRAVVRRGDYEVGFSEAMRVALPANMTSDFSRVTCQIKQGPVIYDNVLNGVIKKKLRVSKEWNGSGRKLNVVLIGIDSVSRSASIRHLKKTRETLKKLGGYDFKGYMKIGDSTGPNVISLLMGRKLDQKECPGMEGGPLDEAPFIWRNFSGRGYATLYAEDVPHRAVFNTMFRGFQREPTHHYMRPYFLAQNTKDSVQYKMSGVLRYLENKGVGLQKSSVFCYQDKPKHEIILNYLRQFLLQYGEAPTFSFTFLTELSHSFINFLAYGDDYMADFANWVKAKGFLEDTVMIFFGDHGPRFTEIRNTFVGRIESRMPFLNVLIPERLKREFPDIDKSLKTNTERLVTVYDIHQTLQDILHSRFNKPTNQVLADGSVRGISLFKPIPKDRSCAQAWIPEEYCACYKSTSVNTTDNESIKKIAHIIVQHINSYLEKETQCQTLSLSNILSSEILSPGLKHSGYVKRGFSMFQFSKPEQDRLRYRVAIETVPGHATFDATCEYSESLGLKVLGEIERTNQYGNQSVCTPHYKLKPYCFC